MSNALKPSADGIKLILDFEVGGGKEYYERLLKRPTYPGEASGVTIGVGYDLGYHSATEIRNDWSMLDGDDLDRLVACQGKTGQAAKVAVQAVKDIEVPWDSAFAVFQNRTIPKYWAQTLSVYKAGSLSAECQWALLSLIFNRGTSMSNTDRRKEMRLIRDDLAVGDTSKIAKHIRDMIRIWVGTDIEGGMRRRRNAEAALFDKGLQVTPNPAPEPVPTLKRILSRGSKGPDVVEWQKLLGFSKTAADGDFGPNTEKATRAFQKSKGLLADGMVGPRTFNAMMGTVKPKPNPTPKP